MTSEVDDPKRGSKNQEDIIAELNEKIDKLYPWVRQEEEENMLLKLRVTELEKEISLYNKLVKELEQSTSGVVQDILYEWSLKQ